MSHAVGSWRRTAPLAATSAGRLGSVVFIRSGSISSDSDSGLLLLVLLFADLSGGGLPWEDALPDTAHKEFA